MALVGLAFLGLLVATIEPLRTGVSNAVQGDTASLRDEIHDLHFGGVLIVLALALMHAVVWYPAEILDAAAGFVYGFWGALPLVMAGWVLNGYVAYQMGRRVARPVLYRFVADERFDQLERAVERGGVTLLLGMRLVPIIPFSLFSIAAGAARVHMPTFLWTTAVGYLPLTAIFVYLGSQLEDFSATDPLIWIGVAALLAMLLLTRRVQRSIAEPDQSAGSESGSDWRPLAAVVLVLGAGGLLAAAGALVEAADWLSAAGLALVGGVATQAGFFLVREDGSASPLASLRDARRAPLAAGIGLMLAAGALMAITGYLTARGSWLLAGPVATLGGVVILAAYAFDRRARAR
jgi:uncharacterized membrane protein YdjX (TVP38/TMEM64 family)